MKQFKIFVLAALLANGSLMFGDTSSLNAVGAIQADVAPEIVNSVGVGISYGQNIYTGVDNTIQLFPLLNLSYEEWFIRGFTGGYKAYEDPNVSFAFILQPTFGGYDSDDSSALAGMDDTSYLLNTGVQVQYRLMPFSLTVAALHDVTGRTKGNSASAKLAAMVPLDDQRFMLIPSIATVWQSSNITGYYYGVSNHEATVNRPKYDPASAWNMEYGLAFKYRMSEHVGLTTSYVLTKYARDISDSPIVSRSTSSAMLASISYIF